MPEKVYTNEQLAQMTEEERTSLLMKAIKFQGTAVLKDANGNIIYDQPPEAGTNEEN